MPTSPRLERHRIASVQDLLPHLSRSQDETFGPLYRGHRDASWKLLPGLFRWHQKPAFIPTWQLFEEKLLEAFWRRAVSIISKPPDREHQLAIAQHYGTPTRLLDWSRSPLVALAFATGFDGGSEGQDGSLWEIRTSATWYSRLSEVDRLERSGSVVKFFPPHISPRITAQHGCFTIHTLPERDRPFVPLEERLADGQSGLQLRCFDIPADRKKAMRHQLADLGFTPATLFPDLDGFAKDAIAAINRALEIEDEGRARLNRGPQ